MTVIYPEGVSALGATKIVACATVANPASPDLSAEIATGLDVSCFMREYDPQQEPSSVTKPPRLCTVNQFPTEGRVQYQAVEVRYVYDPQAAPTADDNKAKALFVRGYEFFAVVRKGLDAETVAMAIGDRTETVKYRCGKQILTKSGNDEGAEFEVRQMWFPLTDTVEGVVVA